ncbi:hypothetical protein HN51_011731 [Arachis hypogaea]
MGSQVIPVPVSTSAPGEAGIHGIAVEDREIVQSCNRAVSTASKERKSRRRGFAGLRRPGWPNSNPTKNSSISVALPKRLLISPLLFEFRLSPTLPLFSISH